MEHLRPNAAHKTRLGPDLPGGAFIRSVSHYDSTAFTFLHVLRYSLGAGASPLSCPFSLSLTDLLLLISTPVNPEFPLKTKNQLKGFPLPQNQI